MWINEESPSQTSIPGKRTKCNLELIRSERKRGLLQFSYTITETSDYTVLQDNISIKSLVLQGLYSIKLTYKGENHNLSLNSSASELIQELIKNSNNINNKFYLKSAGGSKATIEIQLNICIYIFKILLKPKKMSIFLIGSLQTR